MAHLRSAAGEPRRLLLPPCSLLSIPSCGGGGGQKRQRGRRVPYKRRPGACHGRVMAGAPRRVESKKLVRSGAATPMNPARSGGGAPAVARPQAAPLPLDCWRGPTPAAGGATPGPPGGRWRATPPPGGGGGGGGRRVTTPWWDARQPAVPAGRSRALAAAPPLPTSPPPSEGGNSTLHPLGGARAGSGPPGRDCFCFFFALLVAPVARGVRRACAGACEA